MNRFEKLELDDRHERPAGGAGAPRETDWLHEALLQRRQGRYENALKYYSRALELDRGLVGGWVGQVQMLILLDECAEAEVWSRKALELFPNHPELLAALAQSSCRRGNVKAAHAASDGALAQPGQTAYRWIVRGELMVVGNLDAQRHCFDKACQIERDGLVPLEIALIYLYYDKPGPALDRARQAVERESGAYYAWYVQATCELRAGLDGRARRSVARSLELCPNNADAERLRSQIEETGASPWKLLRRLLGR